MATKKATKKVAKKTVKKQDKVYYVVMKRKLFSAEPVALFSTREAAREHSRTLDSISGFSFNMHTVQRVELEA